MRTDELDFDLPPELIAQTPPVQRDASRLLHYRRADHTIAHRVFWDLPGLLRRGDVLVFNDTRVIPARLQGIRVRGESVAEIEVTLHARENDNTWRAFVRPAPLGQKAFELALEMLRSVVGRQHDRKSGHSAPRIPRSPG